jgi:hypothetical protein
MCKHRHHNALSVTVEQDSICGNDVHTDKKDCVKSKAGVTEIQFHELKRLRYV